MAWSGSWQDHHFFAVAQLAAQLENVHVQVEQQLALPGVAHPALGPQERGDPCPGRDRLDPVQASGRIDDGVAGGQLDLVLAVGVFDDQLAALIFLRLAEKHRGRDIGAHLQATEAVALQGVVDMIAVQAAALVAVEHRRHGDLGQRRRHELRVAPQAFEHRPVRFTETGQHEQAVERLTVMIQRRGLEEADFRGDRFVAANPRVPVDTRRRWMINIRNALIIIGLAGFVTIWARELQTIALSMDEPVLFSRPAIDPLFESAAAIFGRPVAHLNRADRAPVAGKAIRDAQHLEHLPCRTGDRRRAAVETRGDRSDRVGGIDDLIVDLSYALLNPRLRHG